MNISTIAQRAKIFGSLLSLFILFSLNANGMDYVKIVYKQVQIGTTLDYDFFASYVASPPELEYHNIAPPQHGDAYLDTLDFTWWYGEKFTGTHHVYYTPAGTLPQRDTLYLAYQIKDTATNLTEDYMDIIIIDIVPRSIFAYNDFVETDFNTPVDVFVLDNDESDFDGEIVDFVALSNNGTCSISPQGDFVTFTPHADFHGVAAFEYTTCNSDGSCDNATVFVGVDSLFTDTLEYNATLYHPAILFDALGSYSITQVPSSGLLTNGDLGELIYTPFVSGGDFVEEIHFEKNNITKVLYINVTDIPAPNILARDDNYWVSEKDSINFRVNSNDLLPLMSLAIVSNPSYGETQYIATGEYNYLVFDDVIAKKRDVFTYRAAAFNWSMIEYAKINMHIDEFKPQNTTYKLTTKKDQPLVLEYKTLYNHPIEMSVLFEPQASGAPSLELVEGSYTWNGQTCYGDKMVVFTPINGESCYTDEFELLYSPGNGNTYPIKVEVSVEDLEIIDSVEVCVDKDVPSDEQCIGNNCVWPGDINNNGIVDARDLLPLAYGIGVKGPQRSNPGILWGGSYSDSWTAPVFNTNIDYKFLDADGNGKIMASDTLAIKSNYNKSNSIYPARISGIGNVNINASYGEGEVLQRAPLYFFPHPDNPYGDLAVGDVLLSDIHLGVNENHAKDIHGLAFTLTYETLQMDSTSVGITFDDNSWFTMNSSVMELTQSPLNGFLDAAISRTKGNSISGFGKIGLAEFIIIIDIEGIKSDKVNYTFQMDGIELMNDRGEITHYPPVSFDVPVRTRNTEDIPARLLAYPNPNSGYFNLHLNGGLDKIIQSYSIYDLNGKPVKQTSGLNEKSTLVDLNDQPSGLYIVKVTTTKGEILTQKIELID